MAEFASLARFLRSTEEVRWTLNRCGEQPTAATSDVACIIATPTTHGRGRIVAILAEVTRGGRIESRHDGVVVVVDVTGKVIASAGDPETVAFFRSSAKPFQAVPLVESGAADRFGFDGAETALGCASHNASIEHQRRVAGMLEKIGLGEEHLRCGFSPPADEREAARLTLGIKRASQIQCECSGEHAGMLAACVHLGYPVEGYNERDHPLQRRVLEIVASALRLDPGEIALGVDGCSLPTFGAPL